jgi:hypothetical protein
MKPIVLFTFVSAMFTEILASEKDLNAYASLGFPIKPKLGIEINSFKGKYLVFNNRLCYMFNQKDSTEIITIVNSNHDSIGTETEKWGNPFGGISYSFIPKLNIKNRLFCGAGLSTEAYLRIFEKDGFETRAFVTWIVDLEYRYKRFGFNIYCTQIPNDFSIFYNSFIEIGFGFSVKIK